MPKSENNILNLSASWQQQLAQAISDPWPLVLGGGTAHQEHADFVGWFICRCQFFAMFEDSGEFADAGVLDDELAVAVYFAAESAGYLF